MPGPLPSELAQNLAQKLRDDQLVLFAGAGLSMQAKSGDGSNRRMPGWNELLERVAAQFGLDPAHYRMDRLTLLDTAEIKHGRTALNDAVRQIIADNEFVPGEAHAALHTLPWAAVCTTNYDTLLDRCLLCEPVVTEDDFQAQMRLPRAQWRKLFKLHGSMDNPHTLTARDYKRWAERHPIAHHFVKDLLVKDTFLFVGYSVNDPHWKVLLDLVETLVGADEKWLYALVWQASDAELEPLRVVHRISGVGLHADADYAAAFVQLRDALAPRLNPVNPRPTDPASFSYDRTQYAQAVRRTYGYADLNAIYQWGPGFARDDVSLADIFVEPDLLLAEPAKSVSAEPKVDKVIDQNVSELERERRLHTDQLESQESRRKRATIVAAGTERLLIIGGPGGGKSTLLRHLLLTATERWLTDPLGAPFPCLVRLSRWAETEGPPDGRLQRYLIQHLPGFAEISEEAAASWHAGKVLWLLDGIDEIRGAATRELFQEELARLAAPGSRHRFIVSTRPAGEPRGGLGAEWLRCELPALSEMQVLSILRNWSKVLEKKDALRLDAVDFAARLARNPGLRQVRGNALLLTMAVLFFKQRKRLPHDRWEFYDGAEQSLRDSWARHRLNDRDAAALPGDYAVPVLERLALDGMCEGRVLFSADQVVATVRAVLASRSWTGGEQDREAPRFLDAARDAIGVLVEQAPERFGFVHLTFQEFLAARALVKRTADAQNIIARYWDHPDWLETWILYALGCQTLQGRFSALFTVLLEADAHDEPQLRLHRRERAALRLAGVGTENLPSSCDAAVEWAVGLLERGPAQKQWMVLTILADWERGLPPKLQALVVRRLGLRSSALRSSAVRTLAAQVNNADVRSALLRACKDRIAYVRADAVRAIGQILDDSEVRRALLAAHKDHSPGVRSAAMETLAITTDSELFYAVWLAGLKDRSSEVRDSALRVASSFTIGHDALDALFQIARHSYLWIQRLAIQVLGDYAASEMGCASLIDAVHDRRLFVRQAALIALERQAGKPTVRDILLNSLRDADWSVRRAAIQALSWLVNESNVRSAILDAAKDKASSVRAAAVRSLGGSASDASIRCALLAACQDRHWSVREAAASALAESAEDTVVCTALAHLCDDVMGQVRAKAANALAGRVDDANARAALIAAARRNDGWGSFHAIPALAARVSDPTVQDTLLSILTSDPKHISTGLIEGLAGAVDVPRVRTALLAAATKRTRFFERASALSALAPKADLAEVRAALLAGCVDKDEFVRRSTVSALAAHGGNRDIRDALLVASKDRFWTVRQAAVQALAGQAEDPAVRTALVASSEDEDQDVSQASVRALDDSIARRKFSRVSDERHAR
jgi:HEAT repeat protein